MSALLPVTFARRRRRAILPREKPGFFSWHWTLPNWSCRSWIRGVLLVVLFRTYSDSRLSCSRPREYPMSADRRSVCDGSLPAERPRQSGEDSAAYFERVRECRLTIKAWSSPGMLIPEPTAASFACEGWTNTRQAHGTYHRQSAEAPLMAWSEGVHQAESARSNGELVMSRQPQL